MGFLEGSGVPVLYIGHTRFVEVKERLTVNMSVA
jgi:hypothetical protein